MENSVGENVEVLVGFQDGSEDGIGDTGENPADSDDIGAIALECRAGANVGWEVVRIVCCGDFVTPGDCVGPAFFALLDFFEDS